MGKIRLCIYLLKEWVKGSVEGDVSLFIPSRQSEHCGLFAEVVWHAQSDFIEGGEDILDRPWDVLTVVFNLSGDNEGHVGRDFMPHLVKKSAVNDALQSADVSEHLGDVLGEGVRGCGFQHAVDGGFCDFSAPVVLEKIIGTLSMKFNMCIMNDWLCFKFQD